LLLGIIATVSIADSAAYFAGKRFGRNKLAPEISPGKTWEGVAGAIVAITLYGVILCFSLNYSFWLIVALWLIVILSIMGDLVESLLKRQAGLKDSSQLLPGHGGVLDRIDGFIPTLAITLFCIYLPLFARLQVHA
jgi:phosphatidate cytidylyltransferase